MKRNQALLLMAVLLLVAVSAYYVVAVYIPAQQQAGQITNTIESQRGN